MVDLNYIFKINFTELQKEPPKVLITNSGCFLFKDNSLCPRIVEYLNLTPYGTIKFYVNFCSPQDYISSLGVMK